MRHAGSESWRVGMDFDRRAATLLYVRDVAGLTGSHSRRVPRLRPAVELRADLAPHATGSAAEQWAQWWQEYVSQLADRKLPGHLSLGPEPAPPPEPGTDLRALYDAVVDDANAWARERKREFVERGFRHASLEVRTQTNETVRRIERELGRPSAPFSLTVRLLPLDRKWGTRIGSTLVLVSEELWQDPDSYDLFLDPVVRALA